MTDGPGMPHFDRERAEQPSRRHMDDERRPLPCFHCGYNHLHWKSCELLFNMRALACREYVRLVWEHMSEFGPQVRTVKRFDESPVRHHFVCKAPPEFLCFWKLNDGLCGSPDGFSSETENSTKIKNVHVPVDDFDALVRGLPPMPDGFDERWAVAEDLLCMYRHNGVAEARARRAAEDKMEGVPRKRRASMSARGQKGQREHLPPRVKDRRKIALDVISEVERRVQLLRIRGIPVTPDTVASMGGRRLFRERPRWE